MKIRQLTIRNRHNQIEVVASAQRGRKASVVVRVGGSRSFGLSIVLTPSKAERLADWLQKWQEEARKKDG